MCKQFIKCRKENSKGVWEVGQWRGRDHKIIWFREGPKEGSCSLIQQENSGMEAYASKFGEYRDMKT